MSEQLPDYHDLSKEERLEILKNLADIAIDIVSRHPDILSRSLLDAMHSYRYGGFACLALQQAIKEGKIIPQYDGERTTLRTPEEIPIVSDKIM